MSKDKSGLTPQERHQIIVDYLKEINKPTKVFHLRWKPGDLLNGDVLDTTPMFWYMKYTWSRAEIEALFYKARIVINDRFDKALQQTFGGSPGARWRGAAPDKPKQKWREMQAEKTISWQAEQAAKLKKREEMDRIRKLELAKKAADAEKLRKEEERKLAHKSKDIWNAVSDFGADKAIDYKTFSENLKDRGVNVSPLLAKQLFDQVAGRDGVLTKQQMNDLLKKLDAMSDASTITWDMLGDKLGCMTIMKRVLLAAGAGEPFNVDDFVFAQKFSFTIDTVQFMNKLTDRDVGWDDRVRAMETLGAQLGTNPMFNDVLARGNIPELLCGWATQILDSKPEVQKTAIDTLPGVFHNAMEFGDKDIAVGHLEEILDNLFKVLDDPNASRNHPAAKDAIDKLVQDVIETGDPESVLFLSGLLAEKTDIANVNRPETRKVALEQLQKIMFGTNSPYIEFDDRKKEAPIISNANLPPQGTVNREWLDIGTNKQKGPSPALMQKKIDPDQLYEEYDNKGKTYPQNQRRDEIKEESASGMDEETFSSENPIPITDPADPYAHLTSNPSTAKVKEPVDFDASKSHDGDHEPCVSYTFDFGDGTPNVTSDKPIVPHPYEHPGSYPVSVVVTDKYGKTAEASLTQKVIDPNNPDVMGPPYAQLTGDPSESKVKQIVYFDASKSHDFKNGPCEHFVFNFGDGSNLLHSKVPKVTHPYQQRGVYPVTVEVTDRWGQKAHAGLNQRVVDPNMQDPTEPYAHLRSEPTEAKKDEPVTFDGSKSIDCDGDPVKKYVFDFGDDTKPVTSFKPIVTHPYKRGGTYPVTLTVTDKYGKKANAELSQRVKDPFNPTKKGPPYAAVRSTPPEADIDEPVTFDASASHDYLGDPCELFVWDFGDGSPKKTSTTPVVQHPYAQAGTYPVTVHCTDQYGQTMPAKCNQRIAPPLPHFTRDQAEKIDDPYVTVESTPTNAKVNEPVTFDASKSHDMDKDPLKEYEWDFGDGTPHVTTKGPIVKHKYAEPGTYPVKVIGTDKYDRKGDAKLTQLVTDPKNPNLPLPPYAHVVSDPTIAAVMQPVEFDASKSHDQFDEPCVQFVWDFGDGSPKETTTGPVTTHPYKHPGTYPVKVVVTDKNNLSAQAGLNQKVVQDGPSVEDPYAAVSSTPPEAKPKEPVLFDASKSHDMDGDPCKTFTWDFGDGSPNETTTTPCINHAYNEPGAYPVTVTVVDKYGRKGDAALTQRVIDEDNPDKIAPPYAALKSTPPEAAVNQPVHFDASDSHDFKGEPCVKYVWDFGDDSPNVTTEEPYVDHPYEKAGVYPVTVEVTDKYDQTGNAKVNQRVREPKPEDPYAALNSTPPIAKPDQPVTFDASRSIDCDGDPCKQFVFDFGDGSPEVTSPDPVVNHAYKEPGVYPVTVTVTDKHGNKGNAALQQKVDDPLSPFYNLGNNPTEDPYVTVTSDPPLAKITEPVTFDASKSHDMDGEPCKNFCWDFGDGSPLVHTPKPVVEHPYAKAGSYPVKVIGTDKYGRKGRATLTQPVVDPEEPGPVHLPPYAAVTSTPPEAKIDEPVTFDASKSVDMNGEACKQFVWDFGDGSPKEITDEPVTTHPYGHAAAYPVSVEVTDKNGLTSTASCNQRVVDPMSSYGNDTNEPEVEEEYTGEDGSALKGKRYPSNRREDEEKTDKPSGSERDYMEPPYAALTSTPPESVPNQVVLCDASKSQDYRGQPCVQFLWNFGDGTPNQTTDTPTVEHPFAKSGTYPVSVVVTDKDGLTGRAQCNQRVREPQLEDPFAHLSNDPQYAKPNEPVTFDASKSHDMDGDPCKQFVWDYGDGTPLETTSTPTTNHVYTNPGSYPVNVTVTDKNGKKGNANVTQQVVDPKTTEVDPPPPIAALESDPHESRPKQPVLLDASKSHDYKGDPCVKFVWDFGDGSPNETTTEPQTKHPYAKPSTYPVSVQVFDKNGKSARAGINQRVSDPSLYDSDPSGGKGPKQKTNVGRRGQGAPRDTDPVGNTFNSTGANQSQSEPPIDEFKSVPPPGMDPDEIGDEFRNITHDAISNAILDPNPQNNKDGKKFADLMGQLDPVFADQLDPEAKRQYGKWKKKPLKPMGPPRKKLPSRPLPKPAERRLHMMQTEVHVDVGKPIMPDI
eukprot:2995_1